MLLGRVIGQVVPCVVTPGLEGVPLLIVQPLDKMLKPKGKAIVAADANRIYRPREPQRTAGTRWSRGSGRSGDRSRVQVYASKA
ncbi:MAG: EutN/CcmL family microcompartment protein [Thermoanaerobaculia bacterium]